MKLLNCKDTTATLHIPALTTRVLKAHTLQQPAINAIIYKLIPRLAIERASLDFTNPPSRQALMQLAAKKNSIPLPLVEDKVGFRLPPERHLLTKQNISLVPKVS